MICTGLRVAGFWVGSPSGKPQWEIGGREIVEAFPPPWVSRFPLLQAAAQSISTDHFLPWQLRLTSALDRNCSQGL